MENRETVNGAVLMVQGTASDVGKSVIVTALCRIFAQDGFRTAPFKSQNMALNSYVTPDGREIGRAQGVQAEACGIAATTDMNPVLIKPTGDMHSQIVVHGQPLKRLSAADYREKFLPEAKPLVMDALNRLRRQYDIVLMEGAGSPAEINLKQRDIVNMNLAGWADAPVILVGDIDRGGVFAFLVGTLELLEPEERARVKGFIINKFRGDLSLLQPGLDWLERRTGIPVLGVLPYLPDLDIEAEDSVVLDTYPSAAESAGEQAAVDIAVIRYPRISNFTDFAPLAAEPDVSLRYVDKPADLGQPDAIILPGTKDTIGDLSFLREQGWDLAIRRHMELREHAQLAGICGGYQMLGARLHDPEAVEADAPRSAEGLGWLPLATTFRAGKKTVRVRGTTATGHPVRLHPPGQAALPIEGYEIHQGETVRLPADSASPSSASAFASAGSAIADMFLIRRELAASVDGPPTDGDEVHPEGAARSDGRVFGTYLHGLFHNDAWRRAWLDGIRTAKGLDPLGPTFTAASRKEAAFDRLAGHVRRHLKLEQIYEIAGLDPALANRKGD
ncbi:cobyric acid synthase [Paenibacillus macerans]|uniref:Cobyric acid synthase n=1 Tax=Paenibacillus macerans TaxID=44252 RepID=A0A090ZV16_PAEMA|nr:cobyric acid synthase [Paenibacillus macerans]KFN07981.1 cobyric acid synthase CobQ [Paenibacillus macerans]MCY7556780.1 cobyric acid synthase [Paenibacillus macerans]MEC0152072.1 cobyric acid synthase [Paenibacillus macerans]SUA85023.1 cobyric acid synthase [Paenibacillus macerans]